MSYGQTHSETLPTVGATAGEDFADMINAVLLEMRATLDAKVTPAGIDINGDLDFRSGASYSAILNLAYLELHGQASGLDGATYPGALYKNAAGELFYNDDAGNAVQLTSAGSVSAAAGNIAGGGYGDPGKVITWNDIDGDYVMGSGPDTTADYADVKLGDVLMTDGSSHWLRMSAAASMSADYTVTWPAALPAADSLLLIDSATGDLSYTRALSIVSLALSSTLGVTGLSTLTGGALIGTNQDITLQGTGELKHGDRQLLISAVAGHDTGAIEGNVDHTAGGVYINAAGGNWVIPIALHVGDSVNRVLFFVNPAGTGNKTLKLYSVESNTGTVTTHETVVSATSTTGSITMTVSPAVVLSGDDFMYAYYEAGDANDLLFGIEVKYTRP